MPFNNVLLTNPLSAEISMTASFPTLCDTCKKLGCIACIRPGDAACDGNHLAAVIFIENIRPDRSSFQATISFIERISPHLALVLLGLLPLCVIILN